MITASLSPCGLDWSSPLSNPSYSVKQALRLVRKVTFWPILVSPRGVKPRKMPPGVANRHANCDQRPTSWARGLPQAQLTPE
eukprot:5747063-Prymnesium_polylepis.1